MITLSYFITLRGRAWYLTNVRESEFATKWIRFKPYNLDCEYTVGRDPHFYDKVEYVNVNEEEDEEVRQATNEDEIENFFDNANQEALPEQELEEETPNFILVPPQESENMYDSALEALIRITTDLGLNADDIPEQFATWMFDTDLDCYLWKSRFVDDEKVWASLAGDVRIETMRRSIIRLLSARATEACVEREFSKEKMILDRLRSRMGSKILKARSVLMDSFDHK